MSSVLVAMSGGVDSSVAACLLQEQGYEVVGSHMSLVHLDGVEHGCCGPAARADAAAVAAIAGFPFKIGAFLRRADELGVDLVASGHYVRTDRDAAGVWHLRRGADLAKDQSYMLHMLGQRQLARSVFPVGGLPKHETRALAERFGLPVASKPDSQELCFAPSGDAGGFVRRAV